MIETYALGSFSTEGLSQWPGIVRAGEVLPLSVLVDSAPENLLELFRDWSTWDDQIATALAEGTGYTWMKESTLTAHLPYMPDNLMGAGANYRKHVIELIIDSGAGGFEDLSRAERFAIGELEMKARSESGKPFVFVGQRSAIAGPDKVLVLPFDILQPDWELELAVVIGRHARRVARQDALAHVAGYTIANDLTARDLVTRPDLKNLGMDWLACKNAPGFKILGPYITPARFVPDPQNLRIRLSLNGQTMQDESTADMIYDVARIVEFASMHVALQPGDVIMTGSPAGNGTHYGRFLQGGDIMVGVIDGLVGAQRVRCVREEPEACGY